MLSKSQRELLQFAASGSLLHGPSPDHQGPLCMLTPEEWTDMRSRGLIEPVGRLPEPQDLPDAPYVVTHVYWITPAGLDELDIWRSGRFASLRSMF